ncbi:hypothetical protein JHK87_053206 [Glycine soja]|nr:hypothetical protein JHK87_053206 [Glycine soja]
MVEYINSRQEIGKQFLMPNGGCKILISVFYYQPNYVGDDCVAYNCMKLKHEDDVRKMFFIYLEYNSKGPIELNATFGHSREEILA